MTWSRSLPVVVGFDGSAGGAAAVVAAAAEAVTLDAALRIVHANVWPILYARLANVPLDAGDWQPSTSVVATVDGCVDRVASAHPGLAVTARILPGPGGPALVEESRSASLLVLGDRGVRGIAGILAGPVTRFCEQNAAVPVMLVGNGARTVETPGLVLVEEAGASAAAVTFAETWARRHDGDVAVVPASRMAAQARRAALAVVDAGRPVRPELRSAGCPLVIIPSMMRSSGPADSGPSPLRAKARSADS